MSDARCTICTHPERGLIERDITSGMPNTQVAAKHGLSKDAVRRHRDRHLSGALKAVLTKRDTQGAATALDRMESLHASAQRVLSAAEAEGKASLSLAAIRELRGIVELLAKLTGELDERPTVQVLNVATSPEWLEVRGRLLQALRPYPEASQAVVLALQAGGGDDSPDVG